MQFLANTLVLASIYGLLATGYVIVYRASRVINFAHGDFMVLGVYFFFSVLSIIGSKGILSSITSAITAFLIVFLLSLLIYRILIHPMLGQPVFVIIMVTIGLSILLHGITVFIWGAEPKSLISYMGMRSASISFNTVALSTFDLAFIITFFALLIDLGLFFKYSRVGIQLRAASENPLFASQRGINIYLLFAFSWGIATLLGAIAGILYGANTHTEPAMAFLALKAMPVAIVGGMYSLLGVVPGAIIVALAENAVAVYFDPLVSDVIPMVILLIVLIVKPWGIFGKEEEIERV